MQLIPQTHHPTGCEYSPWDQLPGPQPSESTYLPRGFYENTAKHLIKDTVRIMANGIQMDLGKVEKLQAVLDTQLLDIADRLAVNPLIKKFLVKQSGLSVTAYKEERRSKLKTVHDFTKPFKHKDMLHRSVFMLMYNKIHKIDPPVAELLPGVPKWTANLVKKLSTTRPLLRKFLDGELPSTNTYVEATVLELAKIKCGLHNKSYLAQIASPKVDDKPFNPGSSKQKIELFDMLGVEPLEVSKKTGNASWGKDQVKEVFESTQDEDVKKICECFLEYSGAAIVRTNFIEGFYNYTVEGRLYSNLKLYGAKTFRYTASRPNILAFPASKSVFSTPVKECFVAREGFLVGAIDYAALNFGGLT